MKAFLSWTLAQGHRKESKNSSRVLFAVIARGDSLTSSVGPGPRRAGCGGRVPYYLGGQGTHHSLQDNGVTLPGIACDLALELELCRPF